MEQVILVSPRYGVSQISSLRNSVVSIVQKYVWILVFKLYINIYIYILQPMPITEIEDIYLVTMTREDELSSYVRIHYSSQEKKVTVWILCKYIIFWIEKRNVYFSKKTISKMLCCGISIYSELGIWHTYLFKYSCKHHCDYILPTTLLNFSVFCLIFLKWELLDTSV